MGITCKPVGKFQSIMKKMENQLEAKRKATKEKKEAKKSKKQIMSVWITGDIHGNPVRLSTDSFYEQKEFRGGDYYTVYYKQVVVLQSMILANGILLNEVIWKDDFDNMFENIETKGE